jgi:hypothetical protein
MREERREERVRGKRENIPKRRSLFDTEQDPSNGRSKSRCHS